MRTDLEMRPNKAFLVGFGMIFPSIVVGFLAVQSEGWSAVISVVTVTGYFTIALLYLIGWREIGVPRIRVRWILGFVVVVAATTLAALFLDFASQIGFLVSLSISVPTLLRSLEPGEEARALSALTSGLAIAVLGVLLVAFCFGQREAPGQLDFIPGAGLGVVAVLLIEGLWLWFTRKPARSREA